MDTEKCRILCAVIQAGSFTAAASRLGYTPSGVMRAVNRLEEEIGCPLLSRTPQGIHVTREGKKLLPAIRQLLRCEEEIGQVSSAIRGLAVGEVAVGTYFSIAANWLPPLLKEFRRKYPGIRVHVEECANKDMYQGLEERRFDCCLTTKRPFSGDWLTLFRDEMMIWLPLDHPLAKAKAFPLSRLSEENFIQPLPGRDTDVEGILAAEHLQYHETFSSVDNYTVYRMVEAGLGISMNNKLMTASWQGKVAVLPMEPPHYIELGLAVNHIKKAAPAVQKFMAYVCEWAKKM